MSGSEAGSYLRLRDSCITQIKAQGPSRTCNESKEEEEEGLVEAVIVIALLPPVRLVRPPPLALLPGLAGHLQRDLRGDSRVYEPQIRACLGTAAHFCEVVVLKLRTVSCASTVLPGLAAYLQRDLRGDTFVRRRPGDNSGANRWFL